MAITLRSRLPDVLTVCRAYVVSGSMTWRLNERTKAAICVLSLVLHYRTVSFASSSSSAYLFLNRFLSPLLHCRPLTPPQSEGPCQFAFGHWNKQTCQKCGRVYNCIREPLPEALIKPIWPVDTCVWYIPSPVLLGQILTLAQWISIL